jgi:hypothetical protein
MAEKGPGSINVRRRDSPNLAFLGLCPSRAFSSVTFEPASRSLAPPAFPAGSAPYVSTSGRGFRGL